MDSKLKTGLISIAALIGGYTFLSKGSKYPMNAETFMASGGKKRPVAMRANKINGQSPNVKPSNQVRNMLNELYESVTGGTQYGNMIRANNIYLNEEEQIFYNIAMEGGGALNANYRDYYRQIQYINDAFRLVQTEKNSQIIRSKSKIYVALCLRLATTMDDLKAKGVTDADIRTNIKYGEGLKAVHDFIANFKIDNVSFKSLKGRNNRMILNVPKSESEFEGLFLPYSFGRGYGNWVDAVNSYMAVKGSIPIQFNSFHQEGRPPFAELLRTKSEIMDVKDYLVKNGYLHLYRNILEWVKFLSNNPSILYIGRKDYTDKFYSEDIFDYTKYSQIRGDVEISKRWDNEVMSQIFNDAEFNTMSKTVMDKIEVCLNKILKGRGVAVNQKETLEASIKESNNMELIKGLNAHFKTLPANPIDADNLIKQYLTMLQKDRKFGSSRMSIRGDFKEVKNDGGGSYSIIDTPSLYINTDELNDDVRNDIIVSNDLLVAAKRKYRKQMARRIETAESAYQAAKQTRKYVKDRYAKGMTRF